MTRRLPEGQTPARLAVWIVGSLIDLPCSAERE